MNQMDRALTVSELNEYVRRLLAGDALLRNLEVSGEISGYKHHISGHRYFSLKDAGARVQCVMFRQNAMNLNFQPQDGMRVRVRASASLFPRDGSYQLYVSAMEKSGVGELYLRFEALKEKLMKEGLFDPAIKRPLPLMPRCIGIATSRTGAAIRDMIRIARRRMPNVQILVAPCAVQGVEAAAEIVQAIARLNDDGRAQVILCGRGGGSIEDLWAFNEECVARAIAASRIPVISCVGHETDFTIADFVADVRAATPSMAAELAVPVAIEMQKQIADAMLRVRTGLHHANQLRRLELNRICAGPLFRDPQALLTGKRRQRLEELWRRCADAQRERMRSVRASLDRLGSKLAALDPEGVLERGYACVWHKNRILTSAVELTREMTIHIQMRDGGAKAQILEMEDGEKIEWKKK